MPLLPLWALVPYYRLNSALYLYYIFVTEKNFLLLKVQKQMFFKLNFYFEISSPANQLRDNVTAKRALL
jgi:hypothetical protein